MDDILLEFFREEKLKFLELEMPIGEVKKYFPNMFSENLYSKTNMTKTFCFKNLILYFYKKHLMSYEIDFSIDVVKLPKEMTGNDLALKCPRKLETFINYLEKSNLRYEKISVETYSFENESEHLLSPNEGIVKVKIGESIYAKFLERELLSIRKDIL